jgi:hypothetical protein
VPLSVATWHFSGDTINTLSSLRGDNGTPWKLSCGNTAPAPQVQTTAVHPTWGHTDSGQVTCH